MREIYLYVVAATLILGLLMPQTGRNRKYYILAMTLIHIFISGFRYSHLTGDLMKYHDTFLDLAAQGWFSSDVYNDGRNFGFFLILKLIDTLTRGNFQVVLFLIALIIHVVLAVTVYRCSPAPWMSYLVWNCLGFYIFGFSSLKQSLAMAFVMLSFLGIQHRRFPHFLICMAIAGAVHLPALVFLPAWWITGRTVTPRTLMLYLLAGIAVYLFKDEIVAVITAVYYQNDVHFVYSGSPGNRFVMILCFALFSLFFSGLEHPQLEQLFHIMIISALLQMFSGFDNLFTRLTDYYFQFSVLYLPMLFFPDGEQSPRKALPPIVRFNARSRKILAGLLCVFLIWFYHTYTLSVSIPYAVDDYLNYRFLWDVK